MNNVEQKADSATTEKYIALISRISDIEDRLRWSELVYFSLNIIIFMFTATFISFLSYEKGVALTQMDFVLIFLCLTSGLSINTYWVTFATRTQLKLKLRYFQARYLERKMNSIGEYIFSDEHLFFEPTIRFLESPDKKESIKYPTKGLSRMDGFIGAAKPRYFSWLMPCLFTVIYMIIFFFVLALIN